ncbi:lysozyme inhibitor LprI family protein [Stenotrophomonas sp.]|uniref:lysozyme inhibitor LprI family protein n=1 Tax=Stenotrophomonas sp. TaxID=69392 RepID=UPI0028AC725F|nr:lysozyme inhibitor LprI family protein [Stenotrophomonas sp.]
MLLLLLALPAFACASPTSSPDYQQAYDTCLEQAGGINNGTVDACSSTVSEQVKVEMTRLYRSFYRRLLDQSPDDAAALDRAQKSWLVYRDLHCHLAGAHVGSPMYSFCPMQLNIARVNELRELVGQ